LEQFELEKRSKSVSLRKKQAKTFSFKMNRGRKVRRFENLPMKGYSLRGAGGGQKRVRNLIGGKGKKMNPHNSLALKLNQFINVVCTGDL
jgi:hypothetical protein